MVALYLFNNNQLILTLQVVFSKITLQTEEEQSLFKATLYTLILRVPNFQKILQVLLAVLCLFNDNQLILTLQVVFSKITLHMQEELSFFIIILFTLTR
jgi:hypothetical protein